MAYSDYIKCPRCKKIYIFENEGVCFLCATELKQQVKKYIDIYKSKNPFSLNFSPKIICLLGIYEKLKNFMKNYVKQLLLTLKLKITTVI